MQSSVVTESKMKRLFVLQKRWAGSLLHVMQSWRNPCPICSFHGEFLYNFIYFSPFFDPTRKQVYLYFYLFDFVFVTFFNPLAPEKVYCIMLKSHFFSC